LSGDRQVNNAIIATIDIIEPEFRFWLSGYGGVYHGLATGGNFFDL